MRNTFLLQEEYNATLRAPVLTSEAIDVLDQIGVEQWLFPDTSVRARRCSMERLHSIEPHRLRKTIPIGSIEFTEAFLKHVYGIDHLRPINIPEVPSLYAEDFLGRRMVVCNDIDSLKRLYDEWNAHELFIKSATQVKSDITGLYSAASCDGIHKNSPLLVSEPLCLSGENSSEWRVFVRNHQVVTLRPYAGNPCVPPDMKLVTQMAASVPQNLRSCTVDIAVTDEGRTVLVEVHNFISCGLYGASMPLSMYRTAFSDELKRNGGVR